MNKWNIFKTLFLFNLFLWTSQAQGIGWMKLSSGTSEYLRAVQFPVDDITGYAVGDNGTILKTTNAGSGWTAQSSGITVVVRSIHFPTDATTGYAVAGGGNILKTTNGGANWTSLTSGTTTSLKALHFPV